MSEIINDFESLSEEDFSGFAGKWIAVVDGKIIASGKSFKEVYEESKKNYPNKKPLIGKLPEAIPTILSIN